MMPQNTAGMPVRNADTHWQTRTGSNAEGWAGRSLLIGIFNPLLQCFVAARRGVALVLRPALVRCAGIASVLLVTRLGAPGQTASTNVPGFLHLAMAPAELEEVLTRHAGEPALLFTESREFPIRRGPGLPARWLPQTRVGSASFHGKAQAGEFYVFQIGVYALRGCGPLGIQFGALTNGGEQIPAGAWRCLSLGGTNHNGDVFAKQITVAPGRLQALWVGVAVPAAVRGEFTGTAQVGIAPGQSLPVRITLRVAGPPVADNGDSVAKNLSRLRWLDSTAGSEATLTEPFTAVRTEGRVVKVLGRELALGEDGLPARILSHFSPANTRIEETAREVLAHPAGFVVDTSAGKVGWQSVFGALQRTDVEATWTASSTGGGLRLETTGRLDYTGSGEVRVRLTTDHDAELKDARLEVPFQEDAARYFMGLNQPGGRRQAAIQWHWDVTKRQDCFWLGDINAGLMLRFKDADYLRPPVNIYYAFRPLNLPSSWGNHGAGGIDLLPADGARVLARAHSGPRVLRKGDTLDFIFELYLTPFRVLDTEKQWAVRFQHPGPSHLPDPLDQAVENAESRRGPNVINVHQASYYSPYINYPYSDDSFPAFRDLVNRAHAKGVKVRVYYTTREITQNMPELFPLHSFNGEIILPGPGKEARTLIHPGGPHPWLVENLREDFIPAWEDRVGGKYAPLDLSVITTPDSRWNNFYLEGLRWLVEKSDVDGVYIDDTALDARSLRRARRVLDTRPGRYIDLHTWNHFNAHAGFANNLTIYMELLPYLDRLWLGEGFNASTVSPDFWLIEMSGLPFGVMSEMLAGANPWRGMVFGETARLGWSGDPRGLWKVWDEFGLQGSEWLPFFLGNCPVKTGHTNILATVYRKRDRAFVALGSWAKETIEVALDVDWKALGLNPSRAAFYAPAIAGVQPENGWRAGGTIPVAPGRGWFLVLDETPRYVARAADATASLVELFHEGFTAPTLDAGWKLVRSIQPGVEVALRANALRLTAPAHVHAGLERSLPKGVRAVEAVIEPGDDAGQDWGPGLALVWPDGKAARLNARLEDMRFGLFADGAFEITGGPIQRGQRLHLRLVLAEEEVFFQERSASGTWLDIGRLARGRLQGDPTILCVGKQAKNAAWRDHSSPGPAGECMLRELRVLGK